MSLSGSRLNSERRSELLHEVRRGHIAAVELFLREGVDVETKDEKGRTLLMTAAWEGHTNICELLMANGADVKARDVRKRTVLHHLAADRRCAWGMNVVELLLKQEAFAYGPATNLVDESGRTPLHWATATGKYQLAALLLTKSTTDVNAKDLKNKTCLHFAASHGREDLTRLLLIRGANVHNRSDGDWTALHHACEAGSEGVARLLLDAGADVNSILRNGRTPLHIAADNGHLATVACLVSKQDTKPDVQDVFGLTAFHLAAQQKHINCLSLLSPSARLLSEDEIEAAKGFDANVVTFGAPCNENKVQRRSIYDLLYNRYNTVNGSTGKPIWPSEKSSGKVEWVHLPANNIKWVEHLFKVTFVEDGGNDFNSLRYLEQTLDNQHRGQQTHSHFMRPLCQTRTPTVFPGDKERQPSLLPDDSLRPYGGGQEITVMFMPYLHYETVQRQAEMQRAISEAESHSSRVPRAALTPDEVLIRAHLATTPPALNIRRTLDQCFYQNTDTQSRDQDQVVYRYQTRHGKKSAASKDPTVIMVDQLWMWIIDDHRLVTAFPQRWKQPQNDPLNILEGIIEDIHSRSGDPVTSARDIATIVAEHCASSVNDRVRNEEQYQFFRMFESSIGLVNDQETNLFAEFNQASAQASLSLERSRRTSQLFDDDSFTAENLEAMDKLLSIGNETRLLTEIKDIRDELSMLARILDDQRAVLPDLRDAIRQGHCSRLSYRGYFPMELDMRYKDQMRQIDTHLRDIERMDRQADRIYRSILDVLDLKQKHASNTSVFETRFARQQAERGAAQSQILMIFTIVTIIFLPLSFIAAFLTINVKEFQTEDGDNSLKLAFVLKWVFGVGFSVAIPLIVLALNLQRIVALIKRMRLRLGSLLCASRTDKKHHEVKE